MDTERVIIEFRKGFGELQIIENGLLNRYRIELETDIERHQLATVTCSTFEMTLLGYKNIGNVCEYVSLEEIRKDTSRSEFFRWFAVGVFGIPIQG